MSGPPSKGRLVLSVLMGKSNSVKKEVSKRLGDSRFSDSLKYIQNSHLESQNPTPSLSMATSLPWRFGRLNTKLSFCKLYN